MNVTFHSTPFWYQCMAADASIYACSRTWNLSLSKHSENSNTPTLARPLGFNTCSEWPAVHKTYRQQHKDIHIHEHRSDRDHHPLGHPTRQINIAHQYDCPYDLITRTAHGKHAQEASAQHCQFTDTPLAPFPRACHTFWAAKRVVGMRLVPWLLTCGFLPI